MRTTTLTLLTLTLGLTACGGGGGTDPAQEGLAALNDGDHAAALEHFNKALEGKTSADEDYYELAVDRARALAYVDADKVAEAITTLAGEATIAARDYRRITTDLVTEKAFLPAVQVMDLGIKAYPEDEKMEKVKEKVIAESRAANDTGALDALSGMGYLGGD